MHNGRPDEQSSQPPPTSSRCLQAPGIFCTMPSNKVLCQRWQIFTMGSVKKPLDGFQTGAQPFNHFKTANGPMFWAIICVPPSLIAASMFKTSSQIGQQSFLCNFLFFFKLISYFPTFPLQLWSPTDPEAPSGPRVSAGLCAKPVPVPARIARVSRR